MIPTVTPARDPLRVGVIGCGPIGTLHAAAVQDSPHAVLAAVCDLDQRRAEQLAHRLGVRARARLDDLLEWDQLDAVTVATPDHLHVELALRSLAAGRHVFCEKPLAATAEEARTLVEAAATQRVALGVNHNRRFGFGYRTARRLVAEGRIGAVRHLLIHVLDRTPPREVVRSPEVMLTTLLTHHLDLARWFGGEVATVGAAFRGADEQGLRRDLVITLQFASGALGTIVGGYLDHLTRTSERAELVGSRGTISVRDVTRGATLWESDPDHREIFEPSCFTHQAAFASTLKDHIQAFLECVAIGRPVPVSGIDGLRGLELIEAALHSHRAARLISTPTQPIPTELKHA